MRRVRSPMLLALPVLLAALHASPAAAVLTVCTGDCNRDLRIDIGDLIVAVKVVLGDAEVAACPSIACEVDQSPSVACVVGAVDNALRDSCYDPVIDYEPCGDAACELPIEYCCNRLYSLCALVGQACIQ